MKINYDNGLIYIIYKKGIADIYIGSTTSFENRKYSHRFRCHHPTSEYYDDHLYTTIRKYGPTFDDWNMKVIMEYPCNSRDELHKKEREMIKKYATMNSSLPTTKTKTYKKL